MINQRNTVQKQIILDALQKKKTHPTIEEVYAEVHKMHPSISKTTVYRNLRQLAGKGLVRQVSLPDGLERYDGQVMRHYHFTCNRCGAILDLELDYLAEMNDRVQRLYGIQVDGHDVIFSGVCRQCK